MNEPGPLRLFVAVTPSDEALAHLAAAVEPLRAAAGAPAWTAPDRWHLTLLFLGAVPPATVAPLCERVAGVVAACPPMTLRLAGGGRFGSVRRPQVLWAGLAGDVVPLGELAARLGRAARALRLAVEDRPFHPHLTLGRWRPGRPADAALADRLAGYAGPRWPVAEVTLVRSTLGPRPRHDRVAGWAPGG
ncbi:RNA 2',3'-cyclic phosphodiesterase [Blastococcus sp. SYSU D00695]